MNATTMTNTNGQARKSLASQLDRLDTILDTLDQGLQEAVASAVQEAVSVAVREAVKGLLVEVMTNPDVLAQLRSVLATPVPRKTPQLGAKLGALKSALKDRVAQVWGAVKERVLSARQECQSRVLRVCLWTGKLVSRCRVLARFKRPLLVSVGVGIVASVGAYFAGPYVAAATGWLSGFATTLGVQAALAFRRLKDAVVSDS